MVEQNPDMPSWKGCTIDKYALLKQIGQGGFGEAYLAWDVEDKKHMVVKMFTLDTLSEEKIASSFETECTAAA